MTQLGERKQLHGCDTCGEKVSEACGKTNAPKEKMFFDVYAHNWGIIIPGPTGVVWEQQTDGLMCHHKFVEGTFVPLRRPRLLVPNPRCKDRDRDKKLAESWRTGLSKNLQKVVTDKLLPLHGRKRKLGGMAWKIYETNPYWLIIELLDVLSTVNYEGDTPTGLTASDIWKLIDNELHWEYEEIEPPKEVGVYRYYENCDSDWPPAFPLMDELFLRGYDNEEGWKWIKLTKFKSGYGCGREVKQFLGKAVVLIYPNSD